MRTIYLCHRKFFRTLNVEKRILNKGKKILSVQMPFKFRLWNRPRLEKEKKPPLSLRRSHSFSLFYSRSMVTEWKCVYSEKKSELKFPAWYRSEELKPLNEHRTNGRARKKYLRKWIKNIENKSFRPSWNYTFGSVFIIFFSFFVTWIRKEICTVKNKRTIACILSRSVVFNF